MAWWLLWLAATSAVEVRVEPLSAVPFEPQSARVTVTNDRAVARSVQVRFQVKPPADSVWQDTVGLPLPASGEAAATIRYELFVPGSNQVEVTVVEAGLSIAEWRGVVEVSGVDEAPLLFPNYYRQSLTRLERGQVTRQPAPAGGLVLPRPAVAPLYAVDEHNRITAQGRPWFPLGIYTTPATAARAAELAEAGFDLVHLYAVPSTALPRILDFLHGQGLRAWIPLAWHDATTSQAQEQARELVEAAGSHPGLALWE
ncbi:MAG: hypothetical protein HUU35_07645, partial [Armatimonadetes bacterium]|nr:hypothetical protein [Armatimonadota bacterium]